MSNCQAHSRPFALGTRQRNPASHDNDRQQRQWVNAGIQQPAHPRGSQPWKRQIQRRRSWTQPEHSVVPHQCCEIPAQQAPRARPIGRNSGNAEHTIAGLQKRFDLAPCASRNRFRRHRCSIRKDGRESSDMRYTDFPEYSLFRILNDCRFTLQCQMRAGCFRTMSAFEIPRSGPAAG